MRKYGSKGCEKTQTDYNCWELKIYNFNIVYLIVAVTNSDNHPNMFGYKTIFQ